jgi:hypothetical protein
MITMTTMTPKPINMGYSSPYLVSGLVNRTLAGGKPAKGRTPGPPGCRAPAIPASGAV